MEKTASFDEEYASQILLYVDADSCPKTIRTIILKAVIKRKIPALFVADRPLPDVRSLIASHKDLIFMHVVPSGEDSADNFLVHCAKEGSIAITHDIPLANRLAEKDMVVLDDRGAVYTKENVKERLSIRNMMTELREYGIMAERTKPLGPKEIKQFANALDRELTKLIKLQKCE